MLERSTALATILIIFIITMIWMCFFSRGLAPILTIFFCIPWVVRKFGKLLQDYFDDVERCGSTCRDKVCWRFKGHSGNHRGADNWVWTK